MPVLYATKSGSKGFQACSGTYRQTLLRALEQQDYVTASELFHQAHSLLWLPNETKTEYRHRLYPQQVLSAQEFNRIKNLPGSQITAALVNQQCGGVSSGRIRRSTPLVGPQLPTVRRSMNSMQRVQRASYEAAEREGFPVQAFKGLGTYGPSPFLQEVDEKGVYTPVNRQHNPGESSGPCLPNQTCNNNLQCSNNVCVVPREQRQCPPFQFPVTLQDEKGTFVVNNPSAKRTEKVSQYSSFWNQDYDTCQPGGNYSAQRWVQNDRLRQYIGLAFDVIQIPVNEWNEQKGGQTVYRDPGTQAPYFERAANGMIFRVYKLNSAYTPRLLAPAPLPAGPPPPPPPPPASPSLPPSPLFTQPESPRLFPPPKRRRIEEGLQTQELSELSDDEAALNAMQE